MKIDAIYLDLDETLIHSIWGGQSRNPNRNRIKVDLGDGDIYYTFKRPSADRIIQECRNIAPTTILTAGTRDYALKINSIMFDFPESNIIGREDFTFETYVGYGKETLSYGIKTNPETTILIDNESPSYKWSLLKMESLGISKDNYFRIRSFIGRKDPERFEGELEELFNKLKS